MEKFMSVGEVAKKMGVTVRTMQYYDKQGLLSPSAESEGGRRLYSNKDMIKLHQVLTMKYLGFSLDDIKNRLISLDTPAEVAQALAEQAQGIRAKIASMSEALDAIEALKEEVLQMQAVDFKKYADIVVNLQMKNEFYGLIKHMDDEMLDYLRGHYNKESGQAMLDSFSQVHKQATQLQKNGISPGSEQGLALAKAFWDMIMDLTGGDMSMLPKMVGFADNLNGYAGEWEQARKFIEPALDAYFDSLGYDPFEQQEELT